MKIMQGLQRTEDRSISEQITDLTAEQVEVYKVCHMKAVEKSAHEYTQNVCVCVCVSVCAHAHAHVCVCVFNIVIILIT